MVREVGHKARSPRKSRLDHTPVFLWANRAVDLLEEADRPLSPMRRSDAFTASNAADLESRLPYSLVEYCFEDKKRHVRFLGVFETVKLAKALVGALTCPCRRAAPEDQPTWQRISNDRLHQGALIFVIFCHHGPLESVAFDLSTLPDHEPYASAFPSSCKVPRQTHAVVSLRRSYNALQDNEGRIAFYGAHAARRMSSNVVLTAEENRRCGLRAVHEVRAALASVEEGRQHALSRAGDVPQNCSLCVVPLYAWFELGVSSDLVEPVEEMNLLLQAKIDERQQLVQIMGTSTLKARTARNLLETLQKIRSDGVPATEVTRRPTLTSASKRNSSRNVPAAFPMTRDPVAERLDSRLSRLYEHIETTDRELGECSTMISTAISSSSHSVDLQLRSRKLLSYGNHP